MQRGFCKPTPEKVLAERAKGLENGGASKKLHQAGSNVYFISDDSLASHFPIPHLTNTITNSSPGFMNSHVLLSVQREKIKLIETNFQL
jgi:hypothetical protein